MGRGKVQMKLIEKQSERKSVYRKRLSGLNKKAYEISKLCDVPAMVISFDSDGKVETFPEDKEEVHAILNKYDLIRNKIAKKYKQNSESVIQSQILKKQLELNQLRMDNENMVSASIKSLDSMLVEVQGCILSKSRKLVNWIDDGKNNNDIIVENNIDSMLVEVQGSILSESGMLANWIDDGKNNNDIIVENNIDSMLVEVQGSILSESGMLENWIGDGKNNNDIIVENNIDSMLVEVQGSILSESGMLENWIDDGKNNNDIIVENNIDAPLHCRSDQCKEIFHELMLRNAKLEDELEKMKMDKAAKLAKPAVGEGLIVNVNDVKSNDDDGNRLPKELRKQFIDIFDHPPVEETCVMPSQEDDLLYFPNSYYNYL